MKLYTENQVREALRLCELSVLGSIPILSEDHIIQELTPIELPSDEEIEEYINSTPYYGHCTPEYCEGIEDGIKWVLSKIQGGKK